MKISDGLPIQFWPIAVDTYNEAKEAYVDQYCFHQEFNCDDTINLQVIDDVHASVLKPIILPDMGQWLNRSSGTIALNDFRTWMNVHTPGYVPPALPPTGYSGTETKEWDWKFSSGYRNNDVVATIGNNYGYVPFQTKKWYSNYSFVTGASYTFSYDFTSYINFYQVNAAIFQIQILDSALNILATNDVAYPNQSGNTIPDHVIGTYTFNAPAGAAGVAIVVKSNNGASTALSYPYAIHSFTTSTTTGHPWSINVGANTASVNLPGNTLANHAFSDFLYTPYNFVPGRAYVITLAYAHTINTDHGNPKQSKLIIADSAFQEVFTQVQNDSAGANTITISFTADATCKNIMFYHDSGSDVTISFASGAATGTINGDESYTLSFRDENDVEISSIPFVSSDAGSVGYLNEVSFIPSEHSLCEKMVQLKIFQDSTNAALFKSDLVSFTQSTEEGIQIFYKSIRSFVGLIYTPDSPYFSIRLPAIFFHEKNPTEVKSEQLSNSVIIDLYSTLKKQKLLSILDVPYYMHTKLQLILMHAVSGSLKINGVEWVVEEAYEIATGDPDTYPMRPATTYLTRKNYSRRNIN